VVLRVGCSTGVGVECVMDSGEKKTSEDLAKITQDIVALRRRIKANAKKSQKLTSETEHLLKKVLKPEE
jgi:hypothetical protein